MGFLETLSNIDLVLRLSAFLSKIRKRVARKTVRIETMIEPGPVSKELGLTEPAVKITAINEGESTVSIADIRLMFCGDYGASVAPEAPLGRTHPSLPEVLEIGEVKVWYVPAEKLSSLLNSLHRPRSTTVQKSRKLRLHPRCISTTGAVYKGPCFEFSLDQDHFGY